VYGREGITPLIMIGIGCELSASRLDRLNPKKEPQYPLIRRLGGSQSLYGCFGEEKNLMFQMGFELRTVQLD